jgi:hypothetical protein
VSRHGENDRRKLKHLFFSLGLFFSAFLFCAPRILGEFLLGAFRPYALFESEDAHTVTLG